MVSSENNQTSLIDSITSNDILKAIDKQSSFQSTKIPLQVT